MEKEINNLTVGDILYCTWGCDRTYVEFYQIVKKTPKSFTVQEIKGKVVDGDPLRAFHMIADESNEAIGEPQTARVLKGKYIGIKTYGGHKLLNHWDGKPIWGSTGYEG